MAERTPEAVLSEIDGLPNGEALAKLVHTLAFAAASERRATVGSGLDEAAAHLGVTREEAETSFGNVMRELEAVDRPDGGRAGHLLLSSLLARGVALAKPEGPDAAQRVAEELLWLSTHTALDTFIAIDVALGDDAAAVWTAVAQVIRRIDEGGTATVRGLGRAEAVVGLAALTRAKNDTAQRELGTLSSLSDPVLAAVGGLRAAPAVVSADPDTQPVAEPIPELPIPELDGLPTRGELVAAPRSPLTLIVLTLTGLIFVVGLLRLLGRFVLRLRRPAELQVTDDGMVILARTELLGKRLRERKIVIPKAGLARATRDLRYPQVPLYVGVAALVIGTFIGVRLFVDGARSGSPALLFAGLAVCLLGLGLDYALSHLEGAFANRCQVVFEPRKGKRVALADVAPERVDAVLLDFARRASA